MPIPFLPLILLQDQSVVKNFHQDRQTHIPLDNSLDKAVGLTHNLFPCQKLRDGIEGLLRYMQHSCE
jgi:hypothetical protein